MMLYMFFIFISVLVDYFELQTAVCSETGVTLNERDVSCIAVCSEFPNLVVVYHAPCSLLIVTDILFGNSTFPCLRDNILCRITAAAENTLLLAHVAARFSI